MPKYVIERSVPGVGMSTQDQLTMMAQKSNKALKELNHEVLWLESYITDDKIFCVYVSPNEDLIRQHAKLAGFPAEKISKIDAMLDPSSGEPTMASRGMGKEKVIDRTMRQ